MPPKAKLHKDSGKPKKLLPILPSTSSQENVPFAETEQARQFEVELCWCIQQLQTALKSGKLNSKQVQEHSKTLNTLMSNSAPIVKKRNVMRLSFGDYRAKMAAEEKKINLGIKTYQQSSLFLCKAKLKAVTPLPSKNSVFIKKSVFLQNTGNTFRFNFPENRDISDEVSAIKLNCDGDKIKKEPESDFSFKQSNNSFKFNFEFES